MEKGTEGIELPPPFYDSEGEYIMKQEDRDILQGKMAEGIHNIWRSVDKIEKHLDKLNQSTLHHGIGIGINKSSIKHLWWLFGIFISGIAGGIIWLGL